jgi:serine/threonine protein kinase
LHFNELRRERDALVTPATRSWWGRAADGARVRVIGASPAIADEGTRQAVEDSLLEALMQWGQEAEPVIAPVRDPSAGVLGVSLVADGAETLAERAHRSLLEPDEALEWVMQVADRLADLHERGMAHGHLRPETVLLTGDRIALLEPRLHAAALETVARRGVPLPADAYSSPEPNRFHVDAQPADIYALGVLLVHLIIGRTPVIPAPGGLEATPLFEALPGPLQRTVTAALHPDPAQRLPGAQKLGLYLRVHRMWSASWNWAPLAAFALAPTEETPAAAARAGLESSLWTEREPEGAAEGEQRSSLFDRVQETGVPGFDGGDTAARPEAADASVDAVPRAAEIARPADALVRVSHAAQGLEWPAWMPRLGPHLSGASTSIPEREDTPWTPTASHSFASVVGGESGSVAVETEVSTELHDAPPTSREPPNGTDSAPEGEEPAPPVETIPGRMETLVIEAQIGRASQRFEVEGDRATVGRSDPARGLLPEIDLRPDDAVSRRHAELRCGLDGWVLMDLGSTNGTRLNGAWLPALQEAPIADGDEIELGAMTTLRVHLR